eukprot:g6803.t1
MRRSEIGETDADRERAAQKTGKLALLLNEPGALARRNEKKRAREKRNEQKYWAREEHVRGQVSRPGGSRSSYRFSSADWERLLVEGTTENDTENEGPAAAEKADGSIGPPTRAAAKAEGETATERIPLITVLEEGSREKDSTAEFEEEMAAALSKPSAIEHTEPQPISAAHFSAMEGAMPLLEDGAASPPPRTSATQATNALSYEKTKNSAGSDGANAAAIGTSQTTTVLGGTEIMIALEENQELGGSVVIPAPAATSGRAAFGAALQEKLNTGILAGPSTPAAANNNNTGRWNALASPGPRATVSPPLSIQTGGIGILSPQVVLSPAFPRPGNNQAQQSPEQREEDAKSKARAAVDGRELQLKKMHC